MLVINTQPDTRPIPEKCVTNSHLLVISSKHLDQSQFRPSVQALVTVICGLEKAKCRFLLNDNYLWISNSSLHSSFMGKHQISFDEGATYQTFVVSRVILPDFSSEKLTDDLLVRGNSVLTPKSILDYLTPFLPEARIKVTRVPSPKKDDTPSTFYVEAYDVERHTTAFLLKMIPRDLTISSHPVSFSLPFRKRKYL
jgi:hypothetical protein